MKRHSINILKSKLLWIPLFILSGLFGFFYALDLYTNPVTVGGFSSDTSNKTFIIGKSKLSIPQNMVRFRDQRKRTELQNLDLFVRWPQLQGFSIDHLATFQNAPDITNLIFVTLKQEEPVHPPEKKLSELYRRYFSEPPWRGPSGLIGNTLDRASGYLSEDILYANHNDRLFMTRCLRADETEGDSLRATCLHEFSLTDDINVYVRFDRRLLDEWQDIDTRIQDFLLEMKTSH